MATEEKVTIRLPDLAVSFLAEQPKLNTNYEQARQASASWLIEKCEFTGEEGRVLRNGDFSYFCAVATPDAGFERFRIYCDWVHWIFPFDDIFDKGGLREDPDGARALLDNLVNCLQSSEKPHTKLVEAHTNIWHRFCEGASKGVRTRFIVALKEYADTVLRQVQKHSKGEVQSFEDTILTRRGNIGGRMLYVFLEYAHELSLPNEVFEHPVMNEIQILAVDWVVIQNDLLSYCKEEEDNVVENLVAACRSQGMLAQAAFDHLGFMLEKLYARFDAAIAELPSWDEQVDVEVKKYVEGVKSSIKANLDWSFRTDRYFGKYKDEVRRTGKVKALSEPLYLKALRQNGSYGSMASQGGKENKEPASISGIPNVF